MSENLPEFRFDNFNIALQKYSLSEITERVKSYSLSRDVETKEVTGYKYIHYGDIHRKIANIIEQKSEIPNIKPGDYELLKQGDIVVADASEDYQGIATPSIVDFKTTYKLVSGLHTIALRPIKSDPMYTYYLFNSQKFRKYGYRVGTGMKVFGISLSNLMKFESYFPSISEQHRIGIFLRKVDNTIVLQQQLLDDYKQLKKAMLQKMFPQKGESVPRIRFAGFSDVWKEKKLDEMGAFLRGNNISKNDLINKGKQKCVLYGELFTIYKEVIYSVVSYTDKDIENPTIAYENDILFPTSTTADALSLINPSSMKDDNVLIGGDISLFRPKENIIDSSFLSYAINGPLRNEISKYAVGTTIIHIYSSELKKVNLYIPSLSEQEKIGNFFKHLDETIEFYEKKIRTYQELKKAMLQKMFV